MGLGAVAAACGPCPGAAAAGCASPPLRASAMAVRPRRVRALLLMPRAHPPAVRVATATTPATPQLVGKDAGNHAQQHLHATRGPAYQAAGPSLSPLRSPGSSWRPSPWGLRSSSSAIRSSSLMSRNNDFRGVTVQS